jgi:hypothetical protein
MSKPSRSWKSRYDDRQKTNARYRDQAAAQAQPPVMRMRRPDGSWGDPEPFDPERMKRISDQQERDRALARQKAADIVYSAICDVLEHDEPNGGLVDVELRKLAVEFRKRAGYPKAKLIDDSVHPPVRVDVEPWHCDVPPWEDRS